MFPEDVVPGGVGVRVSLLGGERGSQGSEPLGVRIRIVHRDV